MAGSFNRIYIAVSLDGYVATPDGGVEWLDAYQAEDFGYDEFFTTIDTIVMGRSTYEQVLGFETWPYVGKRSVVVTSRPLTDAPDDTHAFHGSPDELVQQLGQDDAAVWIMGGAKLIQAFLNLDAIAMMELFVMPVLLGDGVRLFEPMRGPRRLSLASAQSYPSGVVKLTYSLGT
jgi:dihydrofolate reductase